MAEEKTDHGFAITGIAMMIIRIVLLVLFLIFIGAILIGLDSAISEPGRRNKRNRYCPGCGREIPWDVVSCPYCGWKF